MSTPSLPKTWQEGNCHCGAIRFRAFLPPLTTSDATAAAAATPDVDADADNRHAIVSCNCSVCTRNGLLDAYSIRDELKVRLGDSDKEISHDSEELRGKDAVLGYYMFGAKQMEHVFCLKCGGSVWVALVGVDGIAINVRMLKDIDVNDLKLSVVDGRSRDPVYNV